MPGAPRREIVSENEVGIYHCTARCVRRAYLCGKDRVTGRNFDHRKEWVLHGLEQLAASFAVDIVSYAIMDNHFHVICKLRPDVAIRWSAIEVTRRWPALFGRKPVTKADRAHRDAVIEVEALDAKMVKQRRQRLASISWFMRCLCEPIARRANKEDACTGRFWEGRFRSQALLDDAAVLACAAYADLNPVRAAVVPTPEPSKHTSIHQRIQEQKHTSPHRVNAMSNSWLSPLGRSQKTRDGSARRCSNDEVISLTLEEYLRLLDWTGRQIRQDKRGAIPADVSPVLERLRIQSAGWVEVVANFGRWFKHAAGTPESLNKLAKKRDVRSIRGIGASRISFL